MKTTAKQQLIYDMMTEPTAKHLCDSGSIYGRNYERNQKKTIEQFIAEPEQRFVLESYGDKYEVIRTVSTFHYLCGLSLDDICDEFNQLNIGADNWNWDADAYGVSFEAGGYLDALGAEIEYTFNTYNYESDLDQVLQGSLLKINDEYYYLIQVHGGCDVRSGYTDARLFACSNPYEPVIHEYLWDRMDKYSINDELEYCDVYDESGKIVPKKKLFKLLQLA